MTGRVARCRSPTTCAAISRRVFSTSASPVCCIRPIEVRTPTATITGWNVRADGRRPADLCGLSGAFVPFAKTKAERQAANDPRPSFEERYGDQAGFVKAVEAATRALVAERFLLQEDADRYVTAAREGGGYFDQPRE